MDEAEECAVVVVEPLVAAEEDEVRPEAVEVEGQRVE